MLKFNCSDDLNNHETNQLIKILVKMSKTPGKFNHNPISMKSHVIIFKLLIFIFAIMKSRYLFG